MERRGSGFKKIINALIKDETIWLIQKAMADVFGCTSDNISLHLKNIYTEGELDKDSTTKGFSVVQKEGNRNIKRTILALETMGWKYVTPEDLKREQSYVNVTVYKNSIPKNAPQCIKVA